METRNLCVLFLLVLCHTKELYGALNDQRNNRDDPINCWKCGTWDTFEACSDPFDAAHPNVLPVLCTTGCYTKKLKGVGESATILTERGCNAAGPPKTDICEYSLYQSICYCNSDKCNSVPTSLYDPSSTPAPTQSTRPPTTTTGNAASPNYSRLFLRTLFGVGLLHVLVNR